MAWREITRDDILSTLSIEETEAYTRACTEGLAQDKQVLDICQRTASVVRGYVSVTGAKMSPNRYEIPENLLSPACDYAVYDILKSLPMEIVEPRRRAREDALSIFRDIAAGRFSPAPYGADEGGDGGSVSRGVQVAVCSRLRCTPDMLKGI